MLPLPASGQRPKSRTSFLPFPSNTTPNANNRNYPYLPPSLGAHLRSRTRLTNLAVVIILACLGTSLLLNISLYLPRSASTKTVGWGFHLRQLASGWDASLEQVSSGVPLSIETTVERDGRYAQLDHLIMVPGHAIWVGHDPALVGQDEEWILENMQKGGSVRTYVKHVREGVRRLEMDPRALLIFSGGATRLPPSPPLPEGLSYHRLATALELLPLTTTDPSALPPYSRAATEEYALDSYENLLFSLARFKEVSGRYPTRLTVVGYGMKRRRFELLHRAAINFPLELFEYVGIDDEGDTTAHYDGELKYGFTPFLSSPSGCHAPLSIKRLTRNPYARYHPYHTSCPELVDLFEWCPPLGTLGQSVDADGNGMATFPGKVPWRDLTAQGATRWGREKD